MSVILHVAMLQGLTLGATAAKRRQEVVDTGPGATEVQSSDGTWMTLVIVHLPGLTESRMSHDVASRGAAERNLIVQVVSPDPTPAVVADASDEKSDATEGDAAHTAGDPVAQSQLFGRYTGQIDSRIQRAWRRPRSPIEGDSGDSSGATVNTIFRCVTRIVQDDSGQVNEIELVECNGSAAWQLSLIRAIQRASPLPAPPHPSVFTNVLTLTFDGRAYEQGAPEHEYEHVDVPRLDKPD